VTVTGNDSIRIKWSRDFSRNPAVMELPLLLDVGYQLSIATYYQNEIFKLLSDYSVNCFEKVIY